MESPSFLMNPHLQGLECLRCRLLHPIGDLYEGCPACLALGYPASVYCKYDLGGDLKANRFSGPERYRSFFPYLNFPTLGEGSTPVIPIEWGGAGAGPGKIWIKNEGANPTGSHKDRMSPLAVARAMATGHKRVIAASSGNAGISLAAYAARAGVACTLVSTEGISLECADAIRAHGAEVVLVKKSRDRWAWMQEKVRAGYGYPVTNFTLPPVGSNPFGVQGYKAVAFELIEQVQPEVLSAVIVPSARGDLLWGIWQGFVEARALRPELQMPRLYAVEPFARLELVLAGHDYRAQFEGDAGPLKSIAGDTVTYQALHAIKGTGGGALHVSAAHTREAQSALKKLGITAECSAAAPYSALHLLVERGTLAASDRVAVVVTSRNEQWFT